MKNKFNETGTYGEDNHLSLPRLPMRFSEQKNAYSKQQGSKIPWVNPDASRILVIELLELVNSEAEFADLLNDRAELATSPVSHFHRLKGGARQE